MYVLINSQMSQLIKLVHLHYPIILISLWRLIDRRTDLWISLQVIVQDIDTDGKVASVERVGSIPALRTKLSPLNNHSMEIDQRK